MTKLYQLTRQMHSCGRETLPANTAHTSVYNLKGKQHFTPDSLPATVYSRTFYHSNMCTTSYDSLPCSCLLCKVLPASFYSSTSYPDPNPNSRRIRIKRIKFRY